MRYVILSIILLAFIQSPDVIAQSGFELSGRVTNKEDSPEPHAKIYFSGPEAYFALTGSDGTFEISNFVPGEYSVRVQRGQNAQTFLRDVQEDQAQLELQVGW